MINSSPNYVKLWGTINIDKPLDGMNFGHYYTTMFHIIPSIQNLRLLFLCRFLWMMGSLWRGSYTVDLKLPFKSEHSYEKEECWELVS